MSFDIQITQTPEYELTVTGDCPDYAVMFTIEDLTEFDVQFSEFIASPLAEMFWEADGVTTIKPKAAKTVDGSHLSGQIAGGIFQP